MKLWWRRARDRAPSMTPSEQALASRLGLDRVWVGHGLMDGRTPLTTITLEGRLPSEHWGTVTRQAAREVLRDWPETADLISVYLQHDPAADPFSMLYGRDEPVP